MSDIAKAMEAEQAYLAYRMKNEEPFHLADAVGECGFASLADYFTAKREYQLGQLDFAFVEQSMPGGVDEIFKMIQADRPGVLFVDWEDTFVVGGDQGMATFNQEYCEEKGITVFSLHTLGGTIVGGKGDFSFGVCLPKSITEPAAFLLGHVRDLLQRHTQLPVAVAGNDITAGGRKICGSAGYLGKSMFMLILHFSFADRSALISEICTTEKAGKPVAYVDFTTRTVFKKEVAEWLRVPLS